MAKKRSKKKVTSESARKRQLLADRALQLRFALEQFKGDCDESQAMDIFGSIIRFNCSLRESSNWESICQRADHRLNQLRSHEFEKRAKSVDRVLLRLAQPFRVHKPISGLGRWTDLTSDEAQPELAGICEDDPSRLVLVNGDEIRFHKRTSAVVLTWEQKKQNFDPELIDRDIDQTLRFARKLRDSLKAYRNTSAFEDWVATLDEIRLESIEQSVDAARFLVRCDEVRTDSNSTRVDTVTSSLSSAMAADVIRLLDRIAPNASPAGAQHDEKTRTGSSKRRRWSKKLAEKTAVTILDDLWNVDSSAEWAERLMLASGMENAPTTDLVERLTAWQKAQAKRLLLARPERGPSMTSLSDVVLESCEVHDVGFKEVDEADEANHLLWDDVLADQERASKQQSQYPGR